MSARVVALPDLKIGDWLELAKPRITVMVAFTALVGFVMSSAGSPVLGRLVFACVGTALVAAGASVLNQVMERDTDAIMLRTRARPIPSGRIHPPEARLYGAFLTGTGLVLLSWRSGLLAAGVALATWLSYLFLYTPLKRRTPLATLVGAVPGALPPVIGWAASRGSLDGGAFVLFAILFLWQIPHFLAIAWLYRDDYARAGFPMLPVLDREGRFTGLQVVVHSLALLAVSLVPFPAGMAGVGYLGGALVLGIALTLFALRLARARDLASARALFLASIVYLPALSSLLLALRP